MKESSSILTSSSSASIYNKRIKKVLDGFIILEQSEMKLPEEVIVVKLDGKRYTTIAEDDLIYFEELQYCDLSENYLDLSMLSKLIKLKVLSLASNAIKHLNNIDTSNSFKNLQSLDLSYNHLSYQCLHTLSLLPSLTSLDLSGNFINNIITNTTSATTNIDLKPDLNPELNHLNSNAMAMDDDLIFDDDANNVPNNNIYNNNIPFKIDPNTSFPVLEHIYLDYNNIDNNNILIELGKLPQLRHISLAHNFLSCIDEGTFTEDTFR